MGDSSTLPLPARLREYMFGLDEQESDNRDVQEAQVFSKGDRAINPEDGSEWRITDANCKTRFGSMTRLEPLSDQSEDSEEQRSSGNRTQSGDGEEIGVPDSAFTDWEIREQPLIGHCCAVCDWQTDSSQRPSACGNEECESGFIRERRKWPDEDEELNEGESEGLNAQTQGLRLRW